MMHTDVVTAVDKVLPKALQQLGQLQKSVNKDKNRRFFPSGIELIQLTATYQSVRFSLVVAGKDAPKISLTGPAAQELLAAIPEGDSGEPR